MTDARGFTGTLSVQAYFPHGRVPGAEVIVVMPVKSLDTTRQSYATAHGTLDATLSSTPLEIRDESCGGHLKGSFVAGSGGLEADVSIDLSPAVGDVIQTIDGHTVLCRSGDLPPLKMDAVSATPMPGATIVLSGNRVIDRASVESVTVTPSRAVHAEAGDLTMQVTVDADPFQSVAIDLSGVRDAMGSPLGLGVLHTRALTASVVDTTFTTSVPAGAIIGDSFDAADGILRIPSATEYPYDYHAVVGLGAVDAPKTLHLKHRFDCPKGSKPSAAVQLVSDGGVVIPVDVGCDDAPHDTAVSVAAGRWALVARGDRAPFMRPCSGPGSIPFTITPYELDQFSFE